MPVFRTCANYYFFLQREAIDFLQGEVTGFGDGKSTQQFLAQLQLDRYAMDGLRSLLSQSHRRIEVSRLTGDQVMSEVARLILAGEIGVALRPHAFFIGSSPAPITGEMTQLPATAVTSTKSEEPESPTFDSSLNPVVQAAALAAAANSGAAFCPH